MTFLPPTHARPVRWIVATHGALLVSLFAPAAASAQNSRGDGGVGIDLRSLRAVEDFLTDPGDVFGRAMNWAQERGEEFAKWAGVDGSTLGAVGHNFFRYQDKNMRALEKSVAGNLIESSGADLERRRAELEKQWEWNSGEGFRDLVRDAGDAVLRRFEPLHRLVEATIERVDGAIESADHLNEKAGQWADRKKEMGARLSRHLSVSTDFGLEPGSAEAVAVSSRFREASPSFSRDVLPFVDDALKEAAGSQYVDYKGSPALEPRILNGIAEAYPALGSALASVGSVTSGTQEPKGAAASLSYRSPFPLAEYPEAVGLGVIRLCPGAGVLSYELNRETLVLSPDSLPRCPDAVQTSDEALADSLLQRAFSPCPDCADRVAGTGERIARDAAGAIRDYGATAIAGSAADRDALSAALASNISRLRQSAASQLAAASAAKSSGGTQRRCKSVPWGSWTRIVCPDGWDPSLSKVSGQSSKTAGERARDNSCDTAPFELGAISWTEFVRRCPTWGKRPKPER